MRLRESLADRRAYGAERGEVVDLLREFVDAERARLAAAFAQQPTGAAFCVSHSAVFDALLGEIFRLGGDAVEDRLGRPPTEADLCVAAVGGYGRRTLSPWSDIDVAFIPSHEEHPHLDAHVREMLGLLADVLLPGQHPGVAHSYRPLGDLGLIDHQTATALLESRLVAGNSSLHVHFMQQLMESIGAVEFVQLNVAERAAVWDDPRQALFAVEPNLKAGPGGQRDFHAAVWAAKVAFRIADWDVLEQLRQRGIINDEERGPLLEALEFQQTCRNWLHFERGLKLDTLHADYQPRLATALGYHDHDNVAASEFLMRDYYRRARIIADFSRLLLSLVRRQRLSFSHSTYVENWTIHPANASIFREKPSRLVRIYRARQRLGLAFSHELERLIISHVQLLDEHTARLPQVGSTFLEILRSAGDVAGTVRAMLHSGVLEQLIPELAPLMWLLPTDPAHEYSVGEHSIKVLEEIQRLRDRPRSQDEELLSEAIRALQEPEVLYLTALLHDIGKLDGTGHHSLTGLPVARAVGQRLGMQDSALERLEFLIREHLSMRRMASLRALELPETIAEFVGILPAGEPLDALDMLAVLTFADTRSVGENVLRDTDKRLLMQLFTRAAKWLQERPAEDEAQLRKQASRRLRQASALRDLEPEVVRRHLDRLPTGYAVNTPPALVAKHIEYVRRLEAGEPAVIEFYHALGTNHTEVTVCSADRPALLRDVAAAVTANNLDIYLLHLDICDRGDEAPGWVIATIWADDFGHELGQVKRDRLSADLESILRGDETPEEVLARRRKVLPRGIALQNVEVNNSGSGQHTIILIRAADQKGLLYRLTGALVAEQLLITIAKVTTYRGAAEDAFYVVKQATHRKLTDDEAAELAERLMRGLGGEQAAAAGE